MMYDNNLPSPKSVMATLASASSSAGTVVGSGRGRVVSGLKSRSGDGKNPGSLVVPFDDDASLLGNAEP